jgi:hypothetical protein
MKLLILLIVVGLSQNLLAQEKNIYKGFPSLVWPKLYDISYKKATDDLGEFDKPMFSTAVRSIEGKSIVLPGYMVPFKDGLSKGSVFILTSLPLNACFFCGVGGPETVIEVRLNKTISYTEKGIEVKGVLKLNDSDPDQMIYILEDAEFLGEIDF